MTATSVRPADSKFAIVGPRRGELVRAHRALQARGGQVKVDLDTAQGLSRGIGASYEACGPHGRERG